MLGIGSVTFCILMFEDCLEIYVILYLPLNSLIFYCILRLVQS